LNIITKTRIFIDKKEVRDNININLYENFKTDKKRERERKRKEKEDKDRKAEDEEDKLKDVIEDFVFELSKFIFYFICTVEFNVAKLIMRYYLLTLIKSGILLDYETVLTRNESNKTVNDFIGLNNDNHRILKYITLDYTKTDGKLYTYRQILNFVKIILKH